MEKMHLIGCSTVFPILSNSYWLRGSRAWTSKSMGLIMRFLKII